MKNNCIFVVGLILLISSCQSKPVRQNTFLERSPSGRTDTRGPIDDCLNHSLIYARYDGLASECTLNYVHYYPEQTSSQTSNGKIRIGSFNVFHLGDNQAPLKDITVVAHIMNQWDLVGAQELMPLATDAAISNNLISQLIEQTGEDNDFYGKNLQVPRPGYLVLLNELRQLDPSWSLILQSMPEGEGTSGEMAGFYYRQTKVQLKEWEYCPAEHSFNLKGQQKAANYGCLVQIQPEQQKLVSRRAFAASFKSQNFEFIALTSHVRFRAADSQEALDLQRAELCSQHVDFKKCKPTKSEVGRYYEVKAVADQIEKMQTIMQNDNVLFMGDFNLEIKPKSHPYWQAALKAAPGFEVFQKAPTTLAVKNKTLKSNYDHFIFNPKQLRECSIHSIRTFDFTARSTAPSFVQKIIAKSARAENIQNQIARRMAEIETLAKAKIKTGDGLITVEALSPKEIEERRKRFERTVERINLNHIGAMMELISDHLPVEMECRTDGIVK